MLGQPWLNLRFSLALMVCELRTSLFVSPQYVNFIRLFNCDDLIECIRKASSELSNIIQLLTYVEVDMECY